MLPLCTTHAQRRARSAIRRPAPCLPQKGFRNPWLTQTAPGRGAPQVLQHLRAPDRVPHVQHRLLVVLVAPVCEQQVALHHLHQLVVARRVLRQEVQPRDLARTRAAALQPRRRGGRCERQVSTAARRGGPACSAPPGFEALLGALGGPHTRGAWATPACRPGSVLAARAPGARSLRAAQTRTHTRSPPAARLVLQEIIV